MAASLVGDLSCPVCIELFRDPVLLSCGHSFCRQCINDHWILSNSRRCPVCRQVSPQPPVSNLSLRNACDSYLREQNTRKDGGLKCQIHREMIVLFCQTDGKAICATCKKHEHEWHVTLPLQQTVRQRKGKLKEALHSAEKTLLTLQNGTSRDSKISKYIKSQSQMTERRIRMEFEKLHQFLRKEEESRIAALNEEEKEKEEIIERQIQGGILYLSDRVRELEERIEDDDITLLKNYDGTMNRAKYTLPDAVALIDVPKYLGNLKYQVWEKMKDICPYYPVILNPNTSPPNIVCMSDDLTSVTSCFRQQDEPNALPLHRNRVVLGSVGYADGVHTWDIEVGNSRHWTLGVCFGSVESKTRSVVQPLTPENGFWGLRRDGDLYRLMNTGMSRINVKRNPEAVRVKIEYYSEDHNEFFLIFPKQKRWRKVSFSDARSDSFLAEFTRVPLENELFPFVIPEDQSVPLRVIPAKVIVTVEQKLSFTERHRVLIFICGVFVMIIALILSWKKEQMNI